MLNKKRGRYTFISQAYGAEPAGSFAAESMRNVVITYSCEQRGMYKISYRHHGNEKKDKVIEEFYSENPNDNLVSYISNFDTILSIDSTCARIQEDKDGKIEDKRINGFDVAIGILLKWDIKFEQVEDGRVKYFYNWKNYQTGVYVNDKPINKFENLMWGHTLDLGNKQEPKIVNFESEKTLVIVDSDYGFLQNYNAGVPFHEEFYGNPENFKFMFASNSKNYKSESIGSRLIDVSDFTVAEMMKILRLECAEINDGAGIRDKFDEIFSSEKVNQILNSYSWTKVN